MQNEYLKQLSSLEQEQFARQMNNMHSDDKTKEACLKYFCDYRNAIQNISNDKLATTIRCAYFIAEKSQCTYNMKGQKIKGIGLSLNQFLKNNQLDDFIIILRDYLKKIKVEDSDTETDLNSIVKRISFLITFHNKFEKIMQKLDLKERNSETVGYSKIFSSFVWLLYIDSKNKVLNSLQLIENTCMLAHVISFAVVHSWEYLRPLLFAEQSKKLTEKRDISMFVHQKVLDMFLIKNVDTYKLIAGSFEDYFSNLASHGIIKFNNNKLDFLSLENINPNYKKLDYYYQKNLSPEELDQRIFFKDRATNLTPSKFTPFSRQGYANKLATKAPVTKTNNFVDSNKENFSSHRILTYEMMEKNESQTPKPITNVNEIKFPKTVVNSPLLTKNNLICSTPVTAGMEMYNYLIDKSKKMKESNLIQRKHDSMIMVLIDKLLDKSTDKKNEKTKDIKSNLIYSLYKLASEEYINTNSYEKQNQDLYKAFLAVSTELVFFVSNITMTFEDIEKLLDTVRIEEWKACDYFLKFDKTMPSTLKLHLLDLEANLVSYKIWENEQIVQAIHAMSNSFQQDHLRPEIIEKCFKRVLHHMAYQITQLSQNFKNGQAVKLQDKVVENIFDTVKNVLVDHTEMFLNRHLDQIVICSFYANCRANQIDIKFCQIKQKYEQSNPNNKHLHDEIICKVFMGEQPRADIIKFYNGVFIVAMKNFVTAVKDSSNTSTQSNYNSNRNNPSNLLLSPLRAIIPKEISFNKLNAKKPVGSKTPQTNLLYAYTESPILKYDSNAFKGVALASKKVINFDEEEKILKKKCTEIAEKDDGLSQTNQFINKKFRKPPIGNPTQLAKKQPEKIIVLQTKQPQPQHHKSLYDRK